MYGFRTFWRKMYGFAFFLTRVHIFQAEESKKEEEKRGRKRLTCTRFRSLFLSLVLAINGHERVSFAFWILVYFETIFLSRENLFTLYLAQSHIYT